MRARSKDGEPEAALLRGHTLEMYVAHLEGLSETVDSFLASGVNLLLAIVDKELADDLLALGYQLKARRVLAAERDQSAEQSAFSFPNPELVVRLGRRMSSVLLPRLVREYERAIRNGFGDSSGPA